MNEKKYWALTCVEEGVVYEACVCVRACTHVQCCFLHYKGLDEHQGFTAGLRSLSEFDVIVHSRIFGDFFFFFFLSSSSLWCLFYHSYVMPHIKIGKHM